MIISILVLIFLLKNLGSRKMVKYLGGWFVRFSKGPLLCLQKNRKKTMREDANEKMSWRAVILHKMEDILSAPPASCAFGKRF